MSLFPVGAPGRTALVAFDDRPAPAIDLFQAVAFGHAVDECSGAAPGSVPRLVPDRSSLTPLAASDGAIALAGIPRAIWAAGTASLPGAATLLVEGYLPRDLAFALPAQPGFPDGVQRLAFGEVLLHRLPVVLRGRVMAGSGVPRAGASVTLSGAWHRVADYTDDGSPATIGALAGIGPGAARERSGPGARARVRDLAPQPQTATLLAGALPGDEQLVLSDGIPLAPGSATEGLLLPGGGTAPEFVQVDTVASPLAPDQVVASLRHPLARPLPPGAVLRRAVLTGAGAWANLQHDVLAGDRTLCLATGAGLVTVGDWLEIDGGGAPAEIRALSRLSTTTDARGAFALPPLHRAALVRLAASHAAEPLPVELTLNLDPALLPARADLLFPH